MSSPRDEGRYPGTFRVATYFPAGAVSRLLTRRDDVLRAIEGMKALEVEHVFLEVYRGGHAADAKVLLQARELMRQAGLRVGGGLTTTWGKGFGAPAIPQPEEQGKLFCYSHPRTAEDIAGFCALAAGLFDELIVDDFFFTNCECDACRAAKGGGAWSPARCRLLADFAAGAMLAPAHRANPNCKVIIKYPQWYDRFQQFGYDALAQTRQFDAIWVGTETRDPKEGRYGPAQQSQSWSVYGYLADLGGAKTLGGWFDPYGCDEPSYVEQGYQTVLVGAPEMLLFNYDSMQQDRYRPMVESLRRHLSRLRRWAAVLRGARPAGLACYKPPNSAPRGEFYVFDYLTMIGLPTTMHARFPADARAVFLPAHALSDGKSLDKARSVIAAGGTVVASAEFVLGLEPGHAVEVFGLRPRGALDEGPALTGQIRMAGKEFPLDKHIPVNGLLESAGAEVLLTWADSEQYAPYLTRKRHGSGSAVMLDVYTEALGGRTGVNVRGWVNMMEMPQAVLDCIRSVITAALRLEIRCPGRVGVYCFAKGPLAVCNYRDEPAEVTVGSSGTSPLGALDRLTPEEAAEVAVLTHDPDRLSVRMPPRSRIIFAPR